MKSLGQDASMLPITLAEDGTLLVEDEALGKVEGFRFEVDPSANHADRKMLLAAAEKALPRILGEKAEALAASDMADVELSRGAIRWNGQMLAKLAPREGQVKPALEPSREISALPDNARKTLLDALDAWLDKQLEPLEPLRKMHIASANPEAGSQARALLLNLIAGHGFVTREKAGIEHLPKEMRPFLRKIGVTFGALDIFAPLLLKPAPRQLLSALGTDRRPLQEAMLPVIPDAKKLPAGYRHAGTQAIRVDLAEKILRAAFEARAKANEAHQTAQKDLPKERQTRQAKFKLDLALPISIGLEADNACRLLGSAGFRLQRARKLAEGAHGPAAPDVWTWRPRRADDNPRRGRDRGGPHRARKNDGPQNAKGKGPHKGPRKGHKGKPQDRRPAQKPDTGPARAGGAFDGLADLLKG